MVNTEKTLPKTDAVNGGGGPLGRKKMKGLLKAPLIGLKILFKNSFECGVPLSAKTLVKRPNH